MRTLKLMLVAALITAAAAPVMFLVAYLMVLALTYVNRPPEADSVYRVHLEYTVTGTPHEPEEPKDGAGSGIIVQASHTVQKLGSGSAVSADGYILTARHVADIVYDVPEMCAGILLKNGRSIGMDDMFATDVRIAFVTLRVIAADGTAWHGYGYAPMDDGGLCDGELVPRIEWHEISRARIVAMDPLADLALIKVDAENLPHLEPSEDWPPAGSALTALGVVSNVEQVIRGDIISPCTPRMSTRPWPSRMPTVQMSQTLRHGMSGGPAVSDDRLLGINVQIDVEKPENGSYAVAGPYVARWYDWVRGRRDVRPLPECPAP
ncbi:MAG TPA: serine protease [Candidatus Paceibacterota bacterium]|nr:serine protease [Candidatus Paceibacterota bacterium]